jgi:hypothetical protein
MKTVVTGLLWAICLFASTSLLSSETEDRTVTEKYRVEYQDPVKLKSRLLNMLSSIEGYDGAKIERLKQRFDISDEIMRSVAMEIYNESIKTLSEKSSSSNDRVLNTYRGQVDIALFCLGLSADQSTKQMLLALVKDSATESSFRQQAISSYLRAADPEEAKNALIRFLVEGERMDSMARLNLYAYARTAYDVASPEKKLQSLPRLLPPPIKKKAKSNL